MKLYTNLGLVTILMIFCIVSITFGIDGVYLLCFFIWGISLIFAVSNLRKRALYFFFLISFFTFLLGGHFCYEYFGLDLKHYFGKEYYLHSNICLTIALTALFIGTLFHERFGFKFSSGKTNPTTLTNKFKYERVIKIRKISLYLFYATFIFWQYLSIERIAFVWAYSYESSYVDFESNAPFLVRALGALAPYYFYLFLATFPSKKKCCIPILLYLGASVISLFTGRRSNFITGFMFILLYFLVRHYRNKKEGWIKRRTVFLVLILVPGIIIIMYVWGFSRVDESVGKISLMDGILGFFQQQGFSSSVLRLEKYYESYLPHDRLYSFYGIVKNFRLNTVIRLIFKPDYGFSYLSNNVDLALKGNSLDHTLSYLKLYNYTSGAGVGSCYIAELYHDFGYTGIVLGNVLYANIMCILSKVWNKNYNVWLIAIGFAMVESFLKAPRWNFDIVIAYFLDFGMWMAFLSVFLAIKIFKIRGIHRLRHIS